MDRPLRLCLVHAEAPLHQALQALGCETLLLTPQEEGLFHLPSALRAHGFQPDVVLQCERLGLRLLLAGLEDIPALRAFWAVDPHLNAYWQAPYARLFHLIFSTQRRFLPHLAACGAERLRHLPWYAPQRPFIPHAQRPRLAGFVGRLGPTRPARTWLAELLRELAPRDFELRDDLGFEPMLDFYQATRAVPNESITAEVNFRLFEAAGCGAVVLAQDLGPEQAELFEPGREILVCADALDLAENLRLLAGRPRLSEALGRAAWERAQAHHLPLSRARTILREVADAPRPPLAAPEATRWLALALAALCEAGRLPQAGDTAAAALAASQPEPLVLSARLRLAQSLGLHHQMPDLLLQARACQDLHTGPGLGLALTCCAWALGLGRAESPVPDLPLALDFARRAKITLPEAEASPVALLLAWAKALEAAQVPPRGGFGFDAARHLPATAAECLHCALGLSPRKEPVLRALTSLLARSSGNEVLRLGLLSDLGLQAQQDWRVGLELGLCNLLCFRPGPGLSEIALAERLAQNQDESAPFSQSLALADASGRIRKALADAQPDQPPAD